MTIGDQDDDTRLYLGPARDATLLEVVTQHFVEAAATGEHQITVHTYEGATLKDTAFALMVSCP